MVFPWSAREGLTFTLTAPAEELRSALCEDRVMSREPRQQRSVLMTDSVYKLIELVGTSSESWEKAAKAAVETAAKSLKDLRVAEVVELDMHIEEGKVLAYRAKVRLSFKYISED